MVDPGAPRLILSDRELDELRNRSASSHARFFRAMVDDLNGRLPVDPPDTLWDLEEPAYSDLLEICFSLMVNCGIAWQVTGDGRWSGLAERWLARWVEVGSAGDVQVRSSYLVAFHVMALAYGVDLFGRVLPEQLIRRAVEVLRVETGRMVRHMDTGAAGWSRRYHYHDCWVPVFGAGVGCLALLPYAPEAGSWLTTVEREVEWIVSIQGEDGAWNEGVAPLNYALGPMLFYLEGRKRVFGENAFDIPWLKALSRWRAYHLLPDGSYVFLDDSTPSGRYHGETGGVVAFQLYKLASEFNDGLAQWQAERESARSFLKDYHDYGWSFLWYNPCVEAKPPDGLPAAAAFPSMGQFVSRTGFDEGASVLSFECTVPGGPLAQSRLDQGLPIQTITQNKHAHYEDRASFTYFVNGHYFFRPSGYFRFDTEFKNALTFDDLGQSVDPDTGGEVTGVYCGENDVYSAARCEAAGAYPDVPGLSAFERTVLHARDSHAVFVLDRVRFSGHESRSVEAHFHVGHEVDTRIEADGSLRLRTPSGRACRLYHAASHAAKFERVTQPVEPFWRDYLAGYDIPPEDLEAMDQADLRFRFAMAGETSLDVLWAILPHGGDCAVGKQTDGSMISFWYAVPGGAPQLVLAPFVEEVAGPVRGPVLTRRPERIYVLGGPSEGTIRLVLEHRDREQWGTVIGEGPEYALNEAGTTIVKHD
ncbi:MAG: hypothetical protein OXU79_19945 [Gemmatimonadota bacterium]|nr:hypothetical protein [Gemmatimonadota bacterium]